MSFIIKVVRKGEDYMKPRPIPRPWAGDAIICPDDLIIDSPEGYVHPNFIETQYVLKSFVTVRRHPASS